MLNNVTAFRPLEDFATLPPKLATLHAWWRAKQELMGLDFGMPEAGV